MKKLTSLVLLPLAILTANDKALTQSGESPGGTIIEYRLEKAATIPLTSASFTFKTKFTDPVTGGLPGEGPHFASAYNLALPGGFSFGLFHNHDLGKSSSDRFTETDVSLKYSRYLSPRIKFHADINNWKFSEGDFEGDIQALKAGMTYQGDVFDMDLEGANLFNNKTLGHNVNFLKVEGGITKFIGKYLGSRFSVKSTYIVPPNDMFGKKGWSAAQFSAAFFAQLKIGIGIRLEYLRHHELVGEKKKANSVNFSASLTLK